MRNVGGPWGRRSERYGRGRRSEPLKRAQTRFVRVEIDGSTYEGEGVLAAAAAALVVVGPASAVASALPDVTVAQSGSP